MAAHRTIAAIHGNCGRQPRFQPNAPASRSRPPFKSVTVRYVMAVRSVRMIVTIAMIAPGCMPAMPSGIVVSRMVDAIVAAVIVVGVGVYPRQAQTVPAAPPPPSVKAATTAIEEAAIMVMSDMAATKAVETAAMEAAAVEAAHATMETAAAVETTAATVATAAANELQAAGGAFGWLAYKDG